MSKKVENEEQYIIKPTTKQLIRSMVLEKIKSDQKSLDINGINQLFDIIQPLNELKHNVKNLNDMDKSIDDSLEKIDKTIVTLKDNYDNKNSKKTMNHSSNKDYDTVDDLKTVLNELRIVKNQISKINSNEIVYIFDKMMDQYMLKINDIVKEMCEQVVEKIMNSKIESIENYENKLSLTDENISQLNKKCDSLIEKTQTISKDIKTAEETVEKISRLERMSRR